MPSSSTTIFWYVIWLCSDDEKVFYHNGLSLVFFFLFILSILGQFFTGFAEHNRERKMEQQPALLMEQYLRSGHFIQATFKNWESEFLQMALVVALTISLRRKGSFGIGVCHRDTVGFSPAERFTSVKTCGRS